MKKFRDHMKKEGYSRSSIDSFIRDVAAFQRWMEEEVNVLESLTFNDLLGYVEHLQKKNLSGKTINSYLKAVEHYLKFEGVEIEMMRNLKVRNRRKRLITADLIPYEKLEQLYDDFPSETNHQKRYKVMLGLTVFQGLNSRDIGMLRVTDIDINSGAIYVSSTSTSNSRRLTLHAKQILPLNVYIEKVRKTFERAEDNGKLFLTRQKKIQMVMHQLKVNVKKSDSHIKSINQMRASVINHWLHNCNLREVQHMCGHKHVSSTEAYLDSEFEELEDELESYHPMG